MICEISNTTAPSRFAICVDNSEYPAALELHQAYRLVPDVDAEQNGDLRLIDESGEDYLYPVKSFVLVDSPPESSRTLTQSFA